MMNSQGSLLPAESHSMLDSLADIWGSLRIMLQLIFWKFSKVWIWFLNTLWHCSSFLHAGIVSSRYLFNRGKSGQTHGAS